MDDLTNLDQNGSETVYEPKCEESSDSSSISNAMSIVSYDYISQEIY